MCPRSRLPSPARLAGCPKDVFSTARTATRLDFEGTLDDPQVHLTDAILRFFRNSCVTAERASLEHRVWFSGVGRTPDEVQIRDEREPRPKAGVAFGLLRDTFSKWREDEAPRMAAALS